MFRTKLHFADTGICGNIISLRSVYLDSIEIVDQGGSKLGLSKQFGWKRRNFCFYSILKINFAEHLEGRQRRCSSDPYRYYHGQQNEPTSATMLVPFTGRFLIVRNSRQYHASTSTSTESLLFSTCLKLFHGILKWRGAGWVMENVSHKSGGEATPMQWAGAGRPTPS